MEVHGISKTLPREIKVTDHWAWRETILDKLTDIEKRFESKPPQNTEAILASAQVAIL
jgi:hypothetical protein